MNLTTVKTLREVKLDGITIDWTKEDKSIKEVTLRDSNGGRLVIRAGTYGDVLKVMVPSQYEEDDRYVLAGKYLGMCDVREFFDNKYDADAKLSEYKDKAGVSDIGLKVEKLRVKIDEAGEVVESVASAETAEEVIF